MGVNLGSIFAKLELNISQFSRNLDTASAQAQQTAQRMSKSFEIGESLTKVGGTLTKAVTLPLLAVGAAAIKIGNDFEYQMSRVKAIAGATGTEMKKLNDQAIKLGASTSFSAKEVAEGMENLASAGFSANEIFQAMPGLMDLAAVSGGDVGLASEVAATAIRGFGLEAGQAAHVADVFARAAADTNAEAVDMGEAMKYVAPVAHAMGLSLEETAAAIGLMSDAGIKGSQAGTTLRGALSRLSKPTKAMRGSMEDLGISFFDAEGKMKPLKDQIGMLKDATSGLTQEEKNRHLVTLYGQESLSGMLALIDAGPEKLGELTNSLVESDGAAKEMADTMMDNAKMSFEEMMGAFESAAILIQQELAPAFRAVADWVNKMVSKFVDASPETRRLILVLAGLAAAVGPVLVVLGSMMKLVSTVITGFAILGGSFIGVTGVIWLVVGVIAALVGAFAYLYKTNETFRKAMQDAWKGIMEAVENAWKKIKPSLDELWKALRSLFYTLEPLWKLIGVFLGAVVAFFVGIGNGFLQALSPAIDTLTNFIDFVTNIISAVLFLLKGDTKNAMAFLKRAFDNWIDGMKNVLKTIGAFFSGFVDGVVGAIKAMLEAVGIDSDKVAANLKAMWLKFKLDTIETIQKVKDFFIGIWEDVKVNWQLFKMWVGDLVQGIADYFIGMWDDVKVNWQLFKMWVGELVDGVAQFFIDMWTAITDTFDAGVEFVKGVWETLSEGFIQWTENFKATYEDTIQSVMDIFTTVGEFFTGAWEVIKNIFAGALLIIADIIAGDFDKIGSDIEGIWTNIMEGLGMMWGSIEQLAKDVFGLIANFLRETWDAIWGKIVEIWTAISTWLSELWAGMVSSVTQFFIDMYLGIMERVKKTKDDVTSWWDELVKSVVRMVIQFVADVKQGFEDMKKRTVELAIALVDLVTKKFREMQQWLAELPGKLYKIGSDMFTSMKNGVVGTVTGVYNAIVEGVGKAVTWLQELPGKAWGWGKDFVMGLVNGILGSIEWVQNAARDVADSIRSFLHFTKPDEGPLRPYEEWMPHMMQGMGKTLKNATPILVDQAKNVAAQMKDVLEGQKYTMAVDALSSYNFGPAVQSRAVQPTTAPIEPTSTTDNKPNIVIEQIVVRNDEDVDKLSQGIFDRNSITIQSIGNTNRGG